MQNLSNGAYNLNIFVDCIVERWLKYLTIVLTDRQ